MLSQTKALCAWNFRSLRQRPGGALVVVTAFFAVVLVFTSVLAARDGLAASGVRPDAESIAVVSTGGQFGPDLMSTVGQMPGVARAGKTPSIVGTIQGTMLLRDRKPDTIDIAAIIGISRSDIAVLPNAHITQGRLFRPGLDEVVIGEGSLRLYPEYTIGHSIVWQHRRWQIVGVFTTGSDIQDSLFWADLRQVQSAMNVGDKYDAVFVRLASHSALAPFKAATEKQPRIGAKVQRLSERDSDTGKELRMVLTLVDGVITLLMAVGAVFAALNVMYATVDRRSGELGVLRALGFSRLPILAAILSESLVLAGIGGAVGVMAAALLLNGFETSTIASRWAVAFRFAVTPSAVITALALTLGMGLIGGLFPAIRAARRPIAAALREE
jgi:putative ABC transport system permease protein